MDEHAFRERVTLLLVNDALEANGRHVGEAVAHLLDAAATLMLTKCQGPEAADMCAHMVQYLCDQVAENTGGSI